jgi:hypothetical protein
VLPRVNRVIEACGIRPLTEPEPDATRAALRSILRRLLAEGWARLPLGSRGYLWFVERQDSPRSARYHLARVLSERPAVSEPAHAYLGEEDPEQPPVLPTVLVGAALALLAQMEVEESRSPDAWRGPNNAFNVLRRVLPSPRWQGDIRALMEGVVKCREASGACAEAAVRIADVGVVAPGLADHEAAGQSDAGRGGKPRPCARRALAQHARALELHPELAARRVRLKDIYKIVRNEVHDKDEDGPLPLFQTWRRYLSQARRDPAAPQRSPRAGREGRSVARRGEL